MSYKHIVDQDQVSEKMNLEEQIDILNERINNLKISKDQLSGTDIMLRNLIELSSDGIVLIDHNGRIVEWNHGEELITGLKKDEMIGKYLWDVQYGKCDIQKDEPPTYDETNELIRDFLDTKNIPEKYRGFEETFIRSDGKSCTIQVKIFSIYTSEGFRICSISHDITERKHLEESLMYNVECSQLLAENAEDLIYIIDPDLCVAYTNPAAAAALGKTPDQLIGLSISYLFPGDTFEHFRINLLNIFENGDSFTDEHCYKFYNKDQWFNVKLTPIKDKNGKVTSIIGINRDLTDRKLAEIALLKKDKEITTILDSMAGYAFIKDSDCRFLMANQRLCDALCISKKDIVGKTYSDILGKDDAEKYQSNEQIVLQTGNPLFIDDIEGFEIGIPIKYSGRIEPLRDQKGRTVGIVGYTFDMTELNEAHMELEDSKAEAEFYVDLLGHDINNMNHIVMGYLELVLSEPDLNDNVKDMLVRSGKVLNNSVKLIDNVRKIRNLRSMHREPIEVGAILSEVKEQYANVPGRAVTINYEPVGGCIVNSSELLKDVFSNLVGNSIKHSMGPITIDISLAKASLYEDHKNYYCVTINDNGPGIPDSIKETLLSSRPDHLCSGNGIGLYLVKNLVETYKGRLWIDDHVSGDTSKGTSIVVMLPALEI